MAVTRASVAAMSFEHDELASSRGRDATVFAVRKLLGASAGAIRSSDLSTHDVSSLDRAHDGDGSR
jgi:hypothetical protein